jgi:hypothetical protein
VSSLDVLADVLEFVLSLIRSHECECKVTNQGLMRCKRCLLLERAGK